MSAIGNSDWPVHDWRGELIDRRMDYYHEGWRRTSGVASVSAPYLASTIDTAKGNW